MNQNNLIIREVIFDDLQKYRKLRLEALKMHPEAFGRDYETDKKLPLSFWENNLRTDLIGTIFIAESENCLIGMSGIRCSDSLKMSYNSGIWGVYVSADYRREKIGEKLINACINWAKQKKLLTVKLAVTNINASAICLYLKCNFQIYGVDPKVIKANNIFYDELLMVRSL